MSGTPAEVVLEVRNLSKSYRAGHLRARLRPALKDLSLTVRRGEIFGYLGPNGSGKTTTLKILMGLVFPDSGSATILGAPLEDLSWKYRAGYLPEQPYFYDYLTAREYLDYVGRLCGLPVSVRRERCARLLELVGLGHSTDVPLRRFSKGMLQRVGLAQALVNDPDLVILDEPMSGLDPLGRRLVRDIILDLRRQAKTVFFSTHILSDAETLCDRVAVLRAGSLVATGHLSEILNLDVSHYEVLATGGDLDPLGGWPPGVRGHEVLGERVRLEVAEEALLPALEHLRDRRGRVLSVNPIRQSLEDFFLAEVAPREGAWELQD
ncbi:MAG: ABC transporter ATP-binding protein [Acidobacteria bacterium]|nr:ABC transporter ATP-binding protein [Acidobacteriota bacterium]